MSADTSILPPEIITIPQPIIGLSGLDITRNPLHKIIWDGFTTNKEVERAAIKYTLISSNTIFPVSKPKRQSYEWYHPKGILKRNWLNKHLNIIPSVVVLFQEIEWNDPQWTEKQLNCASSIQSLKNDLQGRNTKLVIVLLQKGAPLPPGEDLLASERAANLTSVCDISAKMLFVLPHNDNLMGYAIRLESAFIEIAQSYYAQMAKQVRLHRDQLTNSHQILRIRHQFKLGFISEMRIDLSTALKHYTQSYLSLEEIRIIDTNCLEIKTIAGFLNYKICRLMFKLNAPRDSITQFKQHMEKYRNRTGFKELLFEHYGWISVQYSSFAELFCDAIKNGLPALQTQHPGIYYHKAAEYIGKRKEAFLQCSAHTLSPDEPYSIAFPNIFNGEFYGIRGSKSSEPITEQQIIDIVQENEKHFNHSIAIIALLSQAMVQFKIYQCLRFRKKLAIDMAEEYLKCGDHSKALTLYSLMLPDYRNDRWPTIFTEVLLKTLRSAYLSASVLDFITCSIEALSPTINIELSDRIIILENLWKVFQNVPPITQSQIAPELKLNWESALERFKSPVLIDLDKINDLIDLTITFERSQVRNDENIKLFLYIRSKTNVPLKLHDFILSISDLKLQFKLKAFKYIFIDIKDILRLNKKYEPSSVGTSNNLESSINNHTSTDDTEFNWNLMDTSFMLEPTKYYKILFETENFHFMEHIELQILKLEMKIGSLERQYAILTKTISSNKRKIFKNYHPEVDCIDNICVYNTCYIIPTFHLTIQTNLDNQPMLLNEYFKISSTIYNLHDILLENVGISITIPNHLKNKVFITRDLTDKYQKLDTFLQIDIGNLTNQSSAIITYYIKSLIDGNIDLIQKLFYQIENNSEMINTKNNNNKNIEQSIYVISSNSSSTNVTPTLPMAPTLTVNTETHFQQLKQLQHNINIECNHQDFIRKSKEDIIIIPCIEEFHFIGQFYSLNKQLINQIYKNEDFLLKINLEIKSTCNIQIIDMYLICDHNISEKLYNNERPSKWLNRIYKKGDHLKDIKMLYGNNLTNEWLLNYQDFLQMKIKPPFQKRGVKYKSVNQFSQIDSKKDDKFKTNLLSKIPINSTIIGSNTFPKSPTPPLPPHPPQSSSLSTLLGSPNTSLLIDDNQQKSIELSNNFSVNAITNSKNIYNNAIDAFQLTDDIRKGFLKGHLSLFGNNDSNNSDTKNVINWKSDKPIFGVYCVKWCRKQDTVTAGSGDKIEINESKFLINGIEIIESPLNIYCYFDKKMYVKVPMIFKITLKNMQKNIIYLTATLKNSENFMFAGNTQLNIAIFAKSSIDLKYNLYPLKAGWQKLPEFEIKYNSLMYTTSNSNNSNSNSSSSGGGGSGANTNNLTSNPGGNNSVINLNNNNTQEIDQFDEKNNELQMLVNRWMPKKVFVLPMMREHNQ